MVGKVHLPVAPITRMCATMTRTLNVISGTLDMCIFL